MSEHAVVERPAAGPPASAHRGRTTLTWWRVLVSATANAWADLKVTFTPLTWTLGWLGRVVMQVIFFALIGQLLGSPEDIRYLFVGNAVMATAMEAMLVVASTTWERRAGTFPLLVAAPGPLWPVFVGRSLQWLPSGIATASVALFAVGPAFGVHWTLLEGVCAFLLLVVVAVTTYGFGLTVAAVVLRVMRIRNLASNLSYTLMMLVCGVVVPVTFWPVPVQLFAQGLPLTHALRGIRQLAAPTPADPVLVLLDAGVACLVGAAWFVVAARLLTHLAESGRRDGSIEFSD